MRVAVYEGEGMKSHAAEWSLRVAGGGELKGEGKRGKGGYRISKEMRRYINQTLLSQFWGVHPAIRQRT